MLFRKDKVAQRNVAILNNFLLNQFFLHFYLIEEFQNMLFVCIMQFQKGFYVGILDFIIELVTLLLIYAKKVCV